jgi:hypothetical protein
MPNNQVSDPITDQEIAFAHLVLWNHDRPPCRRSRRSKPRHRRLHQSQTPCPRLHARAPGRRTRTARGARADLSRRAVEGRRRLNLGREQVLARLWEIANLSPELTRSSITGQVKAISMIVAIEGLIPDRRAVSSEKKSAPPPTGQIYTAAWLREQQRKTTVPQPSPDLVRDEDSTGAPDARPLAADAPSDLGPAPDPTLDPSEPIFVRPFSPTETTPSSPHARVPASAPDKRVPSSIEKNPSTWRLRL